MVKINLRYYNIFVLYFADEYILLPIALINNIDKASFFRLDPEEYIIKYVIKLNLNYNKR